MARKIHSRYKITGSLTALSPIHVGGLGGNVDTDLALAVNGKGEYYIPGTSLAGALRNWMEIIDSETTNFLWGYQDPNSQEGYASFILVEDSIIELSGMTAEIRDGVAIDRNWGTAVERMKFDRMILPRGVNIPLEITLERRADLLDEQWINYQSKFTQLLAALQNGQISLGAAKTRGLGRVKLDKIVIKEEILGNRKGILNTLLNQGSQVDWNNLISQNDSNLPAKLEIEIHWKPISPVMVKAEGEGITVDILPLVSGFHSGITFVLPGSSIKGALRTQAERILRTVLQRETPRIDDEGNKNFNDQIDLPLIKTLFGSPAKLALLDSDTTQEKQEQQLGYLGALSVDDCFAKIPLKSWSEVENAINEETLISALIDNNLNNTQQAFHVGIDRWTGGAADSFLYTVLEPIGFSWYPLNLSLDLHRLNRTKQEQEEEYFPGLVLLLLTLRDLMNERIPLGFGINRGMGAIKINTINFKGIGELKDLDPLKSLTLTQNSLLDINRELLEQLSKSWQVWIENKLQEA